MDPAALTEENRRLRAELAQLQAERRELELMLASLRAKVTDLQRRLFGPKSEKSDPRQIELAFQSVAADALIAVAEPPQPKPMEPPAVAPRKGGGRRPAPANLPVERVLLDLPAEQKAGMVFLREEITEEIDYVPSRFIRRQYVRPIYAPADKLGAPRQAPLPCRVIPQSGVGTGLLAHVVVSKYADHLPLYRQEQIAARHGLDLDRQKMSQWVEQVALLLQGVYDQLGEKIRQSGYVQVDETPVKVLDAEREHASRQGWLWAYHAPTVPALIFDFSLSRGRDSPRNFFPVDWRGQLQSDGYQVYPSFGQERSGIVPVRCWAHARRKWVEAIDGGGQTVAEILALIAKLYQIEADAQDLVASQREALRQSRSVLLLAELQKRFHAAQASALPQSAIGKAAAYALERWEELERYAQPGFGHVLIDNNPVENGIRPTALGKKNWLFIGHPDAGWKSAVIYSVLGTCKLLRVDPERYLNWALPQLAAATNKTATALLPHDYQAAFKEPAGA